MDITKLVEENEKLKNEIIELKEQLKKYTYGNTHKRYYEKNRRVSQTRPNLPYKSYRLLIIMIYHFHQECCRQGLLSSSLSKHDHLASR